MWSHVVSRVLPFSALLTNVYITGDRNAPTDRVMLTSLMPSPCRFWILYRAYHDGHTFIVSLGATWHAVAKPTHLRDLGCHLLQIQVLGWSAQAAPLISHAGSSVLGRLGCSLCAANSTSYKRQRQPVVKACVPAAVWACRSF